MDMNTIIWSSISLASCLVMMVVFPRLSGILGNVSFKEEMAHRDNHSAGILVASSFMAVGLVIAGAASGDFANSLADESISLVSHAIFGLVLVAISRIMFDKIVMPSINIHDEVMKDNKAAAYLDAGNMLSTSIVIYAVMRWSESESIGYMFMTVGAAWVTSQLILFFAAKYRQLLQNKMGTLSIEDMIKKGNTAAAIRFSGFRLSIAIVIMTASSIVDYDEVLLKYVLIDWSSWALGLAVVCTLVSFIAKYVIINMRGIDCRYEIETDRNIGVASLEAAIYISVAMIFYGILI